MLASKRSLPFMFGSVFLPPIEPWDEENVFDWGSASSKSDGDVLLLLPELVSDGEFGSNGSKRTGGGEESGDELSGGTASLRYWRERDRNADGGIINSSPGGEDKGEVLISVVERLATFDRGVLNLVSTTRGVVIAVAVVFSTRSGSSTCSGNVGSFARASSASNLTVIESASIVISCDIFLLFAGRALSIVSFCSSTLAIDSS
jgi:hypothetical protein